MRRIAIRTFPARLEAGGRICKDVKLALFGILYVFCFDDAIPIQSRYPLKSALVVWSKGIRAAVVWYARGGVATVDDGRSGSLGIVFWLFRRLLILVTDVLCGSRATRRRFGRFLAALFYIQLLVSIDSRVGKGHELVEHRKFKLQLDAVNHRLQCGFNLVNVGVLHGKQANVHSYDD